MKLRDFRNFVLTGALAASIGCTSGLIGGDNASGMRLSNGLASIGGSPAKTPLPGLRKVSVKKSGLLDELRQKARSQPGISKRQLAEIGNNLIREKGFDYTFDWTPKEMKEGAEQARQNDVFALEAAGIKGERYRLEIRNPDFGHPCYSVVDIPVSKVLPDLLTIAAEDAKIEISMPSEFYLEEFVLLDGRREKSLRRWKTPIDAVPFGISEDLKNIYFETWEFGQDPADGYKEFEIGLVLEVSEQGQLRFVPNDMKGILKGKEIKSGPDAEDKGYLEFMGKNGKYIISYSYPCT